MSCFCIYIFTFGLSEWVMDKILFEDICFLGQQNKSCTKQIIFLQESCGEEFERGNVGVTRDCGSLRALLTGCA